MLSERDRLIEEHTEYARTLANYFYGKYGGLLGVPREDFESDAFLGLWRGIEKYLADGKIHSLKTTITMCVNVEIVNTIRRRKGRHGIRKMEEISILDSPDNVWLNYIENEEQPFSYLEFIEQINALPERLQFVMISHLAGYKQREIGERLGLTETRISQLFKEGAERLSISDRPPKTNTVSISRRFDGQSDSTRIKYRRRDGTITSPSYRFLAQCA